MNLHHFLARGPVQAPAVRTGGSSLKGALGVVALGSMWLASAACQSVSSGASGAVQLSSRGAPLLVEASASVQEMAPEMGSDEMGSQAAEKDQEGTEGKPGKPDKKPLSERIDEAVEAKVLADQDASYKQVELDLARLDRDAGEIEVAESLREKREALVAAREALGRYIDREMPLDVRSVDLSLERSKERLLKAETDLSGMRDIMEEGAEAQTQSEVVRRYERSVDFARESLGIEVETRAMKVEAEFPAKQLKLAGAVHAAEAKLQAGEIKADKDRRSAVLKVQKAKHALDASKRAQKKSQKEVAALRKEAGGASAKPGKKPAREGVKNGDKKGDKK